MGDALESGLTFETCDRAMDDCSDRCDVFTVEPRSQGWWGLAWLSPPDNHDGSQPGVRFASRATAVEFTAWGARGGETVSFFAGRPTRGEPHAELDRVQATGLDSGTLISVPIRVEATQLDAVINFRDTTAVQ
jgi:hypothetical protein